MHWRRLFVENLEKMSWRGPIHSPRSRHNPKEAKKPQKNTKQNTKHNPNPKNKQNQKHTREKVIGWPVQQRQIDGEEWYSDRGKDRMSVWKTAMICFLAKCKAKPLILSEGTRFFHLSPQLEWRRFCALGSDFAACVGNSAFWPPQIEWRPNRCRNRYTVPIR